MIARADIVERVAEWQLTEQVIEKDYVLGWLLWGIGTDPTLSSQWVFKGGTCLGREFAHTRSIHGSESTTTHGVIRAVADRVGLSVAVTERTWVRLLLRYTDAPVKSRLRGRRCGRNPFEAKKAQLAVPRLLGYACGLD